MAQLVVGKGVETGKTFDLKDRNTVGAAGDCTVVLQDPAVSGLHLRIEAGEGGFRFETAESAPPIVWNGKEVTEGTLNHGDILQIGETVLFFVEDEEIQVTEAISEEEIKALESMTRVSKQYDATETSVATIVEKAEAPSRKLVGLIRISEAIGTFRTLEEILEETLALIFETFRADRGVIARYEEEEQNFRILVSRAKSSGESLGKTALSRGILHETLRTRRSMLLEDAQEDARFGGRESVASQNIRSVMSVPIFFGRRLLGVVLVDTVNRGGVFSEEDLKLLSAVSHQVALAIENDRLSEAVREKAMLEREIELGARFQRRVLPVSPPPHDDIEVFGTTLPVAQVGGDFYDFIPLAGDLYVGVGDVAGKGINAGLVMIMTHSFLHAAVEGRKPVHTVMKTLNRHLLRDTIPEVFVTFLLLRWEAEKGHLTFCNAGHERLLVLNPGEEVRIMPSGGLPLGIRSEAVEKYEENGISLVPNGVLLLYTDGVTEARGPGGEMFGMDRLKEAFRRNAKRQPKEIVEGVLREVRNFAGLGPRADDITLVAVKRRA
ncbi:MAG: SpoIIE family protein phosphatase [Planctomycetota bacterium]|jgi:serine phosphatase RsbU (regulator of sigma subunit)